MWVTPWRMIPSVAAPGVTHPSDAIVPSLTDRWAFDPPVKNKGGLDDVVRHLRPDR